MSTSRPGTADIGAAAIAGVVMGHNIGYLLTFRDARQRAAILHATGHGYWSFAARTAVGAAALVLLIAVECGARRSRLTSQRPPLPLVRCATLAPLQLGLFALMEIVERLISHAPVSGLAHDLSFVIGIATQVAVAAAITGVLRLTERLAECVATALTVAPTWPRTRPAWPTPPTSAGPDGSRPRRRSRAPPQNDGACLIF